MDKWRTPAQTLSCFLSSPNSSPLPPAKLAKSHFLPIMHLPTDSWLKSRVLLWLRILWARLPKWIMHLPHYCVLKAAKPEQNRIGNYWKLDPSTELIIWQMHPNIFLPSISPACRPCLPPWWKTWTGQLFRKVVNKCWWIQTRFLATLVALHFTPVSKSVGRQSFELA